MESTEPEVTKPEPEVTEPEVTDNKTEHIREREEVETGTSIIKLFSTPVLIS